MKTRDIAIISVMSALTVAVAYSKGLALPFLPGLIDFTPVLIFILGFCFGNFVGGAIGALSMTIYMLIPGPFAHPAAWLFTISPILLTVQAALGAMFGIAGGLWGSRWKQKEVKKNRKFVVEIALAGFILTFIFQILSSVGFYLAYPTIYPSIWIAILYTFIPLYYPYPPITQVVTNTILFTVIGYPIIRVMRNTQWVGIPIVNSKELTSGDIDATTKKPQ